MKLILLAMVCGLVAPSARAVMIEGVYGASAVDAHDLNSYRAQTLWNNTTATSGALKNPTYFGVGISGRFLFHARIGLRVDNQSPSTAATPIQGAAFSVTDHVSYLPLYLTLELPLYFDEWVVSFGGGIGYAINYQYQQKITSTADGGTQNVDWQAHPIGLRARVSVAYRLSPHFAFFAESFYEHVQSTLKAAKDSALSSNGSAVSQGSYLLDNQGQPVRMDLSGIHYGGGIRVTF